MSIDPFRRDEPPDTRHDAPTRRFEGFLGTHDVPSSSSEPPLAPDTSPSVDLFAKPQDDFEAEEEDLDGVGPGDVTRTLCSDRKTLPSARMTPPPPAKPPPLSEKPGTFPGEQAESPDEAPSSSSSIWGRVQRFVAKLAKKQPSSPPNPLASREKPALRSFKRLVWTLDDGEIDELASHLERVVALRRLGADAYAEARILETLGEIDPEDPAKPSIDLSALRARVPEITSAAFDEAIARLVERRRITFD